MLNVENEAQFDALKNEHDVLVAYFTTSTCDVGEALLPKVVELLDAKGVPVVLVNNTELPAVAGQLLVLTVPTIVIFAYGREFDRLARHISVAQVEAAIDHVMEVVDANRTQ